MRRFSALEGQSELIGDYIVICPSEIYALNLISSGFRRNVDPNKRSLTTLLAAENF